MELKKGEQLQGGKYKIIRVLGQGGFGITYEAEQVSLNRVVAIKEFFMKDCCERAAGSSHMTVGTGIQQILVKKFRDKFIKEVKLMASMNHRNIVRVFDVFEENGTAYYVMEKLSGGSLASLVQQNGPLPEKQAEIYIRQIAEALSYIHAYNTVHLDVKPSNILMNAEGDAVLIDFGTSKHYDEIGDQTSTTPVGFSRGFAPLEQYRDGDVSQFKPSTDIYALGATLYFMVTGSVPPEASVVYEEGLAVPTSVSERMRNVITKSMCPRRIDRPQDIQGFKELWNVNIDTVGETTVPSSPGKTTGKFRYLTDDGEVVISQGHGKCWLSMGDERVSELYDEVLADTLVDDCIVCTRRGNQYAYTLIDKENRETKSTPFKYDMPRPLSGIITPSQDDLKDSNIYQFFTGDNIYSIIENTTQGSNCFLRLKKESEHYIIAEQKLRIVPKLFKEKTHYVSKESVSIILNYYTLLGLKERFNCDEVSEVNCIKTGAKGYYRIVRSGKVGMAHIDDKDRVHEIFPFEGKDDIDFERCRNNGKER